MARHVVSGKSPEPNRVHVGVIASRLIGRGGGTVSVQEKVKLKSTTQCIEIGRRNVP